jgi:hypothetical protein
LVLSGILESTSARSTAVASCLSRWLRIHFASALNRFYRLLRNHRIDDLLLTKQHLALLARALGRKLLVCVDWTEWHEDMRMLVASVVADRRALPVQTAAFFKDRIPRSQNSRENAFISTLGMLVKELGLRAIILCDRGFMRVSWLNHLAERGLEYVVRLKQDLYAHVPGQAPQLLSQYQLRPGQVLDLGWVDLRDDGAGRARVVGVWAKGAREAWWLATNLNCGVRRVVAYYDRRMSVEEQIRDTKGCRFGVQLKWTQFRKPEHLSRFAALVGLAIMLWTAAGYAAAMGDPSLRFNHPTKGPRFSYVNIGIRTLLQFVTAIPLTAKNLEVLIPKPVLREFAWLTNRRETTSTE